MKNCKPRSLVILITLVLSVLYVGCSNDHVNIPPILLDTVEDVSIVKDSSLTLTLLYISGYDEDGDDFTLVLNDGDNYSLAGTTIYPNSGFIGDLFVPVQISDSKDLSNVDTMIISVVNTIQIQPVYDSSWWNYNDSIPVDDTVLISKLVLNDSAINLALDSVDTVSVFRLNWSNLAEHEIDYLVGNDSSGQLQYGVQTPYDTIIKPQLQHMYPCSLNSTWPFTLIKYNVSDNLLFEDTTVTMTCTDTAVYVTVPAGTFKCFEYTFYYDLPESRSSKSDIVITPMNSRAAGEVGTITEKIYYSDGVGYVQNITMNGTTVIWKKVLTDYYVEEVEK